MSEAQSVLRMIARLKAGYVCAVGAGLFLVAIASFFRDHGELSTNISIWFFVIAYGAALRNHASGLFVATVILCIGPALHEQINAFGGTKLHAWAYPGVDAALGFLIGWAQTSRLDRLMRAGWKAPSTLVILHIWILISAAVTVSRNVWQSASEITLRGSVYNGWLVRGISWNDDYYPLQDAYFLSIALVLVIASIDVLRRYGNPVLFRIVSAVALGAFINVVLAVWQKSIGRAWIGGDPHLSANAFWPDLHSFGAFMALALFLAFGAFRHSRDVRHRCFMLATVLAGGTGLFLSGSRSTLLLTVLAFISGLAWIAWRKKGFARATALISGLALFLAVGLLIEEGYRGVSFDVLRGQLANLTFESFNAAVKQRPEMWLAALRMLSAFPFFGLGQGSFYRLSSIPDFSGSAALVSMGGSGAHNYFLQTFAELGLVGLCLVALFCVPFVAYGSRNLRLVSFYGLVGIAVGNIYAHSLLVRETLMLAAILLGSYLWEVRRAGVSTGKPTSKQFIAWSVVAAAALVAGAEVVLSFGRFPFEFGEKCFVNRPLDTDHWASGIFRVAIPDSAEIVQLAVRADRPDLERRPLEVAITIMRDAHEVLASETFSPKDRVGVQRMSLDLSGKVEVNRYISVRSSHCYVPLNLGVTYDSRLLGVRIEDLQFARRPGALGR